MSEQTNTASEQRRLSARDVVRAALVFLIFPLLIFAAAGTFRWAMGWVYVALNVLISGGGRLLLALRHPDLAAERAASNSAEDAEPWDKTLASIVAFGFLIVSIVAGLDHRWGWSGDMPAWLVVVSVFLTITGWLFSTWAMFANRFFSGVVRIQTERGHHVIKQGPYRIVRHPGYSGVLLTYPAISLMLGSWWGLIPAGLTIVALIIRTALEDRTLAEKLPGYAEFTRETRYRLIPGIW